MLLYYTTTHSTRLQQHGFIYMHTDSDTDCISKLSRNRELQQRRVVLMKNRGDGLTAGEPVCLSKAKETLRLRETVPQPGGGRRGQKLLQVAGSRARSDGAHRTHAGCPQSRRLGKAVLSLSEELGKSFSVARGGALQACFSF